MKEKRNVPGHSRTITSILVDDEPEALDILEDLLRSEGISVLRKTTKVENALPDIIELKPDIVFLDIQMPGKNGFDLVRQLRELREQPAIIFITAYSQYAVEAIRHAAFDFILKPIDPAELNNAICRFINQKESYNLGQKVDLLFQHLEAPKLRFNTRSGFILLEPDEILYCSADSNYTIINRTDGSQETITLTLGQIDDKLAPFAFKRVSRSTVVNLKYLVAVDRKKKTCELKFGNLKYELDVTRAGIRMLVGEF